MPETKHTPGPWHVGYDVSKCAVYMKPVSEGWLVRDQIAKFDRSEEGMANARLIAAAPDLVEALTEIIERYRTAIICGGTDEEYADIAVAKYRAALRRALGREG